MFAGMRGGLSDGPRSRFRSGRFHNDIEYSKGEKNTVHPQLTKDGQSAHSYVTIAQDLILLCLVPSAYRTIYCFEMRQAIKAMATHAVAVSNILHLRLCGVSRGHTYLSASRDC